MPERAPAQPACPVPANWTPEQAESVFLFLHRILDAIWAAYEPALIELAQRDLRAPPDVREVEPADEIPH
jgi:hypothetical protein